MLTRIPDLGDSVTSLRHAFITAKVPLVHGFK